MSVPTVGPRIHRFVIGVTGRTCVTASTYPHVARAVERFLATLKRHVDSLNANGVEGRGFRIGPGGRLILKVSSSLAAGADQLVAEAAASVEIDQDLYLPANPTEYRDQIAVMRPTCAGAQLEDRAASAAAKTRFDALSSAIAGAAESDIVQTGFAIGATPDERSLTYRRASVHMLAHCDVLLAILPRAEFEKPKISNQLVREAVGSGKPVILIDHTEPPAPEATRRPSGFTRT